MGVCCMFIKACKAILWRCISYKQAREVAIDLFYCSEFLSPSRRVDDENFIFLVIVPFAATLIAPPSRNLRNSDSKRSSHILIHPLQIYIYILSFPQKVRGAVNCVTVDGQKVCSLEYGGGTYTTARNAARFSIPNVCTQTFSWPAGTPTVYLTSTHVPHFIKYCLLDKYGKKSSYPFFSFSSLHIFTLASYLNVCGAERLPSGIFSWRTVLF